MATLQFTIPDQLANEAQQAGVLTSELFSKMLREQLRIHAGSQLRAMWQNTADEISEGQLEQITADIKAARRAK